MFPAAKALPGRELYFQYGQGGRSLISTDFKAYQVTTDENGRFAFPQVPPGKHRLTRLAPLKGGPATGWSLEPLQEVEIRPGETTQVTIGGSSHHVAARLRWPQELNRDPSWKVSASLRTPLPRPPENAVGNAQALAAWQALPEVQAALTNMRHFPLEKTPTELSRRRLFQRENTCFLSQLFDSPTAAGPVKMHARAEASVTVPSDPPSGTVDLGEVLLKDGP